ncbi:MAG: 4Fe-4S binding protein [Planctomycetota bacterium]
MGKWRAVVLTAVHIVIAIHIIQWLVMGSTLSPVEPSESMKTLELGVVNTGFIFFTLAFLSTLLFGRFFCGWGCHVVALQDLCAWLMKKLGAKPKPFRSRLLLFAPLALGLYMFVWPTFKRFAVLPVLDGIGVAAPIWLSEPPAFHGFESELIVQDFWATFPPWYVAIPFLGVCGFACVYFLGSKGFCAYGCPYGGLFGVMDRASPGKIVVSDACEGCGHCTSVCTSNIRVHEEVRDFGAVVSSGCMKCLDCVSACPTNALRFGISRPAMLATPKDADAKARRKRAARSPRRYDLGWSEDIAIAGVAFICFLGFRGMFNLIPMLMAVGMALVAAYLAWTAYRTLRIPNVRMQSVQLKSGGRIRAAGAVVIVVAVAAVGSALWSASINWMRWTAHLHHDSLGLPAAITLRPEFEPSQTHAASIRTAISRYERSGPPELGGMGWSLRPQDRRELAFLYVLDDRLPEAIEQLDLLTLEGKPTTELILQQAELRKTIGDDQDRIASSLERVLAVHTDLHDVRVEWTRLAVRNGESLESIVRAWDRVLAEGESADARLAAARAFAELGQRDRAIDLAVGAATRSGGSVSQRIVAARLLASLGDAEAARASLLEIDRERLRTPDVARELADALATVGERAVAMSVLNDAIDRFAESASLHEARGLLSLVEGDAHQALTDYQTAAALSAGNPFALAGIGETIVRAGFGSRNRAVLDAGLNAMRQAAEMGEHAILHHDYGQALLAAGRRNAAERSLHRAVELAPGNAAIARSLAVAGFTR